MPLHFHDSYDPDDPCEVIGGNAAEVARDFLIQYCRDHSEQHLPRHLFFQLSIEHGRGGCYSNINKETGENKEQHTGADEGEETSQNNCAQQRTPTPRKNSPPPELSGPI